MRIAVDARELAPHPTGVGRYLLEILQVWAADPAAADCEILLCTPSDIDVAPAAAGGATIRPLVLTGLDGTAWEQVRLPLGLLRRCDVLWGPAYSAPAVAPAPTVVTIHDLSYAAHPEWFRPREGARRRWTTRVAAANAAHVLTVSAFSKAEIVRLLGLPPHRITVTPHGVTARLRPAAPAADDAPPLVLAVGTQLNRRHLPDLVRAFAPLAQADPRARLAIVGDNRTWPREDAAAVARGLGIGPAVSVRAWVSDAELSGLYGAATAFAWLSTYEGFGLPPLEAMAAGVPVVAYDTPVAREVYGTAADLVPVGDLAAVTAALRAVSLDPSVRAARRLTGLRHVGRFAWTRTAAATLAVLREAAR